MLLNPPGSRNTWIQKQLWHWVRGRGEAVKAKSGGKRWKSRGEGEREGSVCWYQLSQTLLMYNNMSLDFRDRSGRVFFVFNRYPTAKTSGNANPSTVKHLGNTFLKKEKNLSLNDDKILKLLRVGLKWWEFSQSNKNRQKEKRVFEPITVSGCSRNT